MIYCGLFFIGAIALWISVNTNEEVYRLALAVAALFPLCWGYFSSPVLFQCLSGIVAIGAYRIYLTSS